MGTSRRVLSITVGLAVALAMSGAPASATGGAKRPVPPPDNWDPRVEKIATFVERARGLDFDHPIPVEFLSDRAFRRKVATDEDDVTAKDRAEAAQFAGQLHALALIGPDVDLIGASSDLDENTVVGYYDFTREVMVIRGKNLRDVNVRVTVAHELVHVLQDQHFDLDALYDSGETSGAAFAIDALVEGDATLIEQDFIRSLSEDEQDEYFTGGSNPDDVVVGEPLPEGVPIALEVLGNVPYVLGPSYVYLLHLLGSSEVDDAFEDPPVTDEDILDPVAGQAHRNPIRVPRPKLASGEKRVGTADEFGAFALYLMLATRTDVETALRAITGWGGDRYIGFERDGQQCVRAAFVGDRPRDTDEIESALGDWAGSLPIGMASVERVDDFVELTSCEDTALEAPTAEVLEEAVYTTLDLRLTLIGDFVAGFDAPLHKARCVADGMVVDPELSPIIQRIYFQGAEPEDLSQDAQTTFYEGLGRYLGECNLSIEE